MRGRVRKARVEHDQLRAVRLPVDDALGVRVEIMAGLKMRADEQDDFRVGMIRAGAIKAHPELITFATSGRTDIGVRVVAVNAPGSHDAFGETILARAPDVIHNLVTAIFDDSFANPRGDVVKSSVPGRLFPLACPTFSGSFQRIKNAIGIVNLIERGRTFGAIA